MKDSQSIAKEQLALVEEMIRRSQRKFTRFDSAYSLGWGLVVLVASLGNYTLLQAGVEAKWASTTWLLILVGFVFYVINVVKAKKQRIQKTYIDTTLSFLWVGFFICLMVIGLNVASLNYMGLPLIMMCYGWALFVSGGILKFQPQILGAFFCWLMGGVAFLVAYPYQLLLLAGAVLVGFILPGYLMSKKSKNV